jgi:hypothetical protein
LWTKELSAKDVHKEIFSVYFGKCLSSKAVYNWNRNFSQGRPKAADVARPRAEVAETTVKRLCCGSRHTGKDMDQFVEGMLKVKLSLYRPWRPLELQEVEAPTFSDIRLTDGGKVVNPMRRPLFTPKKIPGTHFC